MITREIVLTVPGVPRPKGSLKCVAPHRNGGARMAEQVKGVKPWMTAVTKGAARAKQRADPHQPVALDITFWFPRPATHYGTGRNADMLKDGAPEWPTSHQLGDLDKLVRAIGDAISDTKTRAMILPDDSQVVQIVTSKRYLPDRTRGPRAVIRIRPVEQPAVLL